MKKLLLITLLLIPFYAARAQTTADPGYRPLAPIPQLTNGGDMVDIGTFLPGLVKLAIGIATILAVGRIIYAGLKYMTTDAWSGKDSAKHDIQEALIGLLLAIGAYTILYTVNPRLVEFNLSAPKLPQADILDTNVNISTGSARTAKSDVETGCINGCVAINPNELPLKGNGLGACTNNPCYISADLSNKLKALNQDMRDENLRWEITEAFPPVAQHSSDCHKPGNNDSGRCVDAALRSTASPDNVKFFLEAIEANVGPSFQYEVCDTSRFNSLKASSSIPSRLKEKIVQCPETARRAGGGEHAHINL